MEIIKNFGIDPYLLAAQVVNFLILFYLLNRFAFKPIMQVLEKRRKDIEEGLKQADEGKHALEKALLEEKKILKTAQSEAQKLLSDAKNQAEGIASDMKTQTKEQVAEMLHDAKVQREREEKDMEKRVAMSAAQLAVEMVRESIGGVFSEKEQQEAIEKLVRNLKK